MNEGIVAISQQQINTKPQKRGEKTIQTGAQTYSSAWKKDLTERKRGYGLTKTHPLAGIYLAGKTSFTVNQI